MSAPDVEDPALRQGVMESLGQNALQGIVTLPQQPLAPGVALIRLMRALPLRVGRPNPTDLVAGVIGVDPDVFGHDTHPTLRLRGAIKCRAASSLKWDPQANSLRGFSCICRLEPRFGKCFADPARDSVPIARARLAEQAYGRVPGAVASFQ